MSVQSDPCGNTRRSASCRVASVRALFVALVVLQSVTQATAAPQQNSAGNGAAQLDDRGENDTGFDAKQAGSSEPRASGGNSTAIGQTSTKSSALRLPARLPDGRPLRPIGIYESQMDELIPNHFKPVSRDRLNEAVSRMTDRATDDQASRLKGAVYWVELVDDTLVSDRSAIDIESDLRGEVRRSLGKVNLAILQPQNRGAVSAIDVLPRLESESDGNLVAVFRGDAMVRLGIEFKWRLRGQVSGSGHEFTMRLPRTPQTRIVLSAPPGVTIEAYDGVLRSRPGPPPDASEFAIDRELRWYELDAGGLAMVRIRTQQQRPSSGGENFVVRRSSVQYEADASGLTWTSTMAVQLPVDSQFPQLAVSGTTITAVKVNATDVPFTSKTIGGREQHLQIDLSPGSVDAQAISVDVTLTGHTTWNRRNGWTDLPMPIWLGDGIVYASSVDDVRLAVIDPLQVMSWQLPNDWRQVQVPRPDDGLMLYAADGPPVALSKSTDPVDSSSSAAAGPTWSRVRFINRPMLKSSDTALRLEVAAGSLTAKARVAVVVDPSRVEPLRIRVEPGWSLDTVSFVHSGRVIDNPVFSENSRILTLWPEADDTSESEIVIEATGTKLLPGSSAGLAIPPSWFVRPLGVRGHLVAAIVPPADLNWSGEAAMQRGRIMPSELTDSEREFFSGLDQETLWFQPEVGRTPSVSLQTPSVSFNAATVFQIGRDRDEVTEQLVVEIESQVQGLKQLVVQTGPPGVRPALSWSISGSNDSPSTSLPSSDVTIGENESDGIYTIDVSDKNLRGRRLIARRRYRIEQQLQLQLPSVSGAASQSSDVIVGHGLLVKQKSRAVQLVPLRRRDDPTSLRESTSQSSALNPDTTSRSIRLRYDAVEQPSITLEKSDVNANVTIVWREQIRVTASSRGTDRIEATYTVSPTAPLEIEYDPEQQLESVSRNGKPVDLTTITITPRTIVLQPRSETETIHIVWNRSQFGSSWVRRCRIPRIVVSGTVLKSEYQLVSSSDTFAPAAVLRGKTIGAGRESAVELRPGENTILIRRNTALAIGWLFALLAFALSWFVAQRSPLLIAAIVVVSVTILILWWPWRLAIIGWLIVPIVAAVLLATSRAWGDSGSELQQPTMLEANSRSRSAAEDLSADFSLEAMARFMLILVMVAVAAPGAVVAQSAQTPQSNKSQIVARPADVLVPVNKDGSFYGEMIYIPGSVHAQLFPATTRAEPQDAQFQSASYRVTIDPTVTQNDRIARAVVDAEFLIHVKDGKRNTNLVRLPLDAALVRRIELIDDLPFIRFEADSAGQVIATLPEGNSFRLRVTLLPAVSESDQWRKLVMSIPPVASSQLTVEAEQNIDALRVGGAAGRLLSETDRRRWVEDLGPVNSLQIDFRTLHSANLAAAQPLQRRYWINAGKRQVTIDCEVDPPTAIAIGETFQFVVRDSDDMPIVTSSAWRLDGSEAYTPTRRLITLTCTRVSPGPIRLLWTRPSVLDRDETLDPVPIRIPEVIAAALGENAPAWIGLHCDPDLQFAPFDRDDTETISVDHFLAAWSGYYGRIIDRAYVALSEIPSLVLQIKGRSEATVSQRHHLHVMPDRLELHYTATLTPSDSIKDRHVLRFPRGLELIRVSANDQELKSPPIRSGDSSEVLLGSFAGAEPVAIDVIAVQRFATNMRFAPPRLSLLPADSTSDLYMMSRDRSTTLKVVEAPLIEPDASLQTVTAESLTQGWIPVAKWKIESNRDSNQLDPLGGLYQVKTRRTRFDCRQVIALTRDERRWSMETLVRFKSSRIPDFIDVEVPARWCESLEVSPTTAWSRQPATDPSRQIIRIRCNREELEGETLSIRGQLQNSETGRVSVPSVRVLGLGQRQTYISVPGRLTNEPIQWRTSAVEAVRLPSEWNDRVATTQRSTYLVTNLSWSIDLAPLPEIDVDAIAVTFDTQVFAQDDGALVMCHWDLFPGGREAVDVRLPRGGICLGAWSAGQAVVAEVVESLDESSDPLVTQRSILRVPLALSRLSQPVEILIRVPVSITKQVHSIPELIGVPVTQSWLTNYVSDGSTAPSQRVDVAPIQDRAIALARSVVDAVEGVDMVAERPRDEVAAWLEVWVTRYRMIAASVGHVVRFESGAETLDPTGASRPHESASVAAQRLSLPSHLQWNELDSRMALYANRFLSDSPSQDSFLFRVADFDGFVAEQVSRLSSADRPRRIQPVSSSDRGLRNLIVNGLTLLLVCGLLACLRPTQAIVVPVVVHPAFWLGLMGIFGFAVAPVPVAAAIVLVAVALPVFPSSRRSRRGSDR